MLPLYVLFLLFLNTLSSSLHLNTLFRPQFIITAQGTLLQSPQLSQIPSSLLGSLISTYLFLALSSVKLCFLWTFFDQLFISPTRL